MADKKISQLTSATTPLAGTEVLPIVQSGSTVKATVANVQEAPVASGTANGVVFLNASKVPTSGSAFTFNGTEVSSTGSIRTSDEFSALGGRLALYRSAGASYIDWASAQNLIWRTVTSVGGSGATTLMTFGSTGDLTVNTGNLVVGTAAKGIDFSANTHAAGMTSELLTWYEEGTWTPTYSASGLSGVTYLIQQGTYTRIGRAVFVVFYIATAGTFTSGSATLTITGLPFTSASTNTSHVGFANATRWATAPVSGRISSSTTSIDLYSAYNGTGPGTDPVSITGSGMTSGDGGNNNIIQASAMYFV